MFSLHLYYTQRKNLTLVLIFDWALRVNNRVHVGNRGDKAPAAALVHEPHVAVKGHLLLVRAEGHVAIVADHVHARLTGAQLCKELGLVGEGAVDLAVFLTNDDDVALHLGKGGRGHCEDVARQKVTHLL